jgi:hypothetical protein
MSGLEPSLLANANDQVTAAGSMILASPASPNAMA